MSFDSSFPRLIIILEKFYLLFYGSFIAPPFIYVVLCLTKLAFNFSSLWNENNFKKGIKNKQIP